MPRTTPPAPLTPGDPLSRGSRIVPVAVAEPPNPFLDLTAWQRTLLHRRGTPARAFKAATRTARASSPG